MCLCRLLMLFSFNMQISLTSHWLISIHYYLNSQSATESKATHCGYKMLCHKPLYQYFSSSFYVHKYGNHHFTWCAKKKIFSFHAFRYQIKYATSLQIEARSRFQDPCFSSVTINKFESPLRLNCQINISWIICMRVVTSGYPLITIVNYWTRNDFYQRVCWIKQFSVKITFFMCSIWIKIIRKYIIWNKNLYIRLKIIKLKSTEKKNNTLRTSKINLDKFRYASTKK